MVRLQSAAMADPRVPTKEEREQSDELKTGHPWSLTLSEFLQKVASDYGYEQDSMEVIDPKGTPVHLPYLRHRETGRVGLLPEEEFEDAS